MSRKINSRNHISHRNFIKYIKRIPYNPTFRVHINQERSNSTIIIKKDSILIPNHEIQISNRKNDYEKLEIEREKMNLKMDFAREGN